MALLLYYTARFLVETSGRAIANRREKSRKRLKEENEYDIRATLDLEMDLHTDNVTSDDYSNDSYDATLMERLEDFIYQDLSHCVFISQSYIREALLEKETEIDDTFEEKLKKLEDLRINLLVVYRRANRFVFPVHSDPNFLFSMEDCFVEPEMHLLRKGAGEFHEHEAVSYRDILNCLRSEKSIRRILVLGEFGCGKNTICSKLILDIVNRQFLFLETERDYKLYICCDLSKFRDWNTKTLDEILIRFCHSYSSVIRDEETKGLLNTFKESILCIFTGYEYLPAYAKEKVDFLLNPGNKEGTIFGHATIVLATTADRDTGHAFKKNFQKHFALSRMKSESAKELLVKLVDGNEEEKDEFVKYLKDQELTFLLEISPLIVIFSCYVYKMYERKERHQFVVELVNLMRECKKDKRIFKSRETFVEKELLKNESVGKFWGQKFSIFNPKAYQCYTYLTGKRQRLIDTFDKSSPYFQRSMVCNLKSVNFEQNVNLYDQQVLAMNSLHKLFHRLHDLRNHIIWLLQLLTNHYVKMENEKNFVEFRVGEIKPRTSFDKLLITIMESALKHVLKQRNNTDHNFVSLMLSNVIKGFSEHKLAQLTRVMRRIRIPLASKLAQSPILFIATIYVIQNGDEISESEVIEGINRCLFNSVNIETEQYTILLSTKRKALANIHRENVSVMARERPVLNYKNINAGFLAFLYDAVRYENRLKEISDYKQQLNHFDSEIFKGHLLNSHRREYGLEKEKKVPREIQRRDIGEDISSIQEYCSVFLENKTDAMGQTLVTRVENLLSRMLEELSSCVNNLIQRRKRFSAKKHMYWDIPKFAGQIKRYEKMLILQEDKLKNWSIQFEDSLNTLRTPKVNTMSPPILKNDSISPAELISERYGGALECLRCVLQKSKPQK